MRRSRRPGSVVAAGLAVAALFLVAGCGGGGGNRGPTQPPPPASSLTFTPGAGGASNAIALARTGATGGDVLELAVQVRQVTGLYGAAFDLGYPSSVLSYEGATAGEFLAAGGFQVSLQVAEETGNLIVGVTRLGAVPAASGSGTLVTLRFRAVASGNGSLSFTRTEALDAQGRRLDDLDFVGGTVQSTL